MTLQAILGKAWSGNWRDTLPYPACPNARTAEEVFSKNYSDRDKRSGRNEITEALNYLVHAYQRGLLYLDTNEILFQEDVATSYDDIHQFLTHRQFHLFQNHRNEIYVYKHQGTKHAILVHRPLCLASSSIQEVPQATRNKRCISAGTLCNLQRKFDGLAPLSTDDKFANHVTSMFFFQILGAGFHSGFRQCAAMYRFGVRLDDTVNPLTENALGKDSGPLPYTLREYRSRPKDDSKSTYDFKVIRRARRVFCKSRHDVTTEEGVKALYGDIMEVLATGDNVDRKSRLKLFYKHFVHGSIFPTHFQKEWEKQRANPGNPNARPVPAATIAVNNSTIGAFIQRFHPSEHESMGEPFWIMAGKYKRELDQIRRARAGEDGWRVGEYPGQYPTLMGMTLSGFRDRCKNRRMVNKSIRTRADRYANVGVHQQFQIGFSADDTVYFLIALKCKHKGETSGYDTDQWSEEEFEWDPPKLNPTHESHVTALKNYYSEHGKFPSGSQTGFRSATHWAKNCKYRYKKKKLGDDHPSVIHLKAIGFFAYNPAEIIKSGNTAFNAEGRDTLWNQMYNLLKDFLSDPGLGGFPALKPRSKDLDGKYKRLAKWVETNKPRYRDKDWTNDPQVNADRFQKLSALKFPLIRKPKK